MIITNKDIVSKKENSHKVDVRRLYDHENAQAAHITLNVGESLKPHKTPVDVFFYILEGSPHIMIGSEKKQITKDNLVESPKNITHCIYNETNELVRVLVVKSPKPKSAAKIL